MLNAGNENNLNCWMFQTCCKAQFEKWWVWGICGNWFSLILLTKWQLYRLTGPPQRLEKGKCTTAAFSHPPVLSLRGQSSRSGTFAHRIFLDPLQYHIVNWDTRLNQPTTLRQWHLMICTLHLTRVQMHHWQVTRHWPRMIIELEAGKQKRRQNFGR